MQFLYITNNVREALIAENCGIETIFVDLEFLGKTERQNSVDAHFGGHKLEDVERLKSVLSDSQLLVRINPLNDGSYNEIDECIRAGADRIMLPMFGSTLEVKDFLGIIDGRVPVCLLAETGGAVLNLYDWVNLLRPGIDEVHFGLNDLKIDFSRRHIFELVTGRFFDTLAQTLNKFDVAWGFGGIGILGGGEIKPELILSEHRRLGSSRVILSRAFRRILTPVSKSSEEVMCREIYRLREFYKSTSLLSDTQLLSNLNRMRMDLNSFLYVDR